MPMTYPVSTRGQDDGWKFVQVIEKVASSGVLDGPIRASTQLRGLWISRFTLHRNTAPRDKPFMH